MKLYDAIEILEEIKVMDDSIYAYDPKYIEALDTVLDAARKTLDEERFEFPEGFFQKERPVATCESLADISEPMQVSEEVLSGKKKLILTTEEPDNEKYYKAEIIGIDGKGGDWCEFWSEIEPIVDKYFGDEWCGTSKPNYDIEKYLRDGWIPCSEREPDKDGDYLVTEVMRETFSDKETGELVVAVESYYTTNSDDGYGGWTYAGWQGGLRVIAWAERPKPYIEES